MGLRTRYLAYYRVSTAQQGRSGLGLEAQRSAVQTYLASNGGEVAAEYVEVESGRRKDREQLKQAMIHARLTRSKLIIAKLDRLARSVSFTAALMEPGVDFVCCDMPHANKFTIHVMSALAEARRLGVKLGSPRLAEGRGSPAASVIGKAAAGNAASVRLPRTGVRGPTGRASHAPGDCRLPEC